MGQGMGEAEIRRHIEGAATDCIFFQRILPPHQSKKVNSYFGGQPRLPTEFAWPTEDGVECDGSAFPIALTFIGQIDLSEIPRAPGRPGLLPDRGTLFFFFNSLWCDATLDNESPGLSRVLFYPGETASLPTRTEPDNLISCYGDEAGTHYPWLKYTRTGPYQYPRSFPLWPVEVHNVTGYNDDSPSLQSIDEAEQRDAHSVWWDMLFSMQAERLTEVFGRPVVRNLFCTEMKKLIRLSDGRPEIHFPDGFPFNWLCVEMIAGNLIAEINRRREWKRLPVEFHPFADELAQQAMIWVERARAMGRFTPLGPTERTELQAWCETVVNSSTDSTDDPRHWLHLKESIEGSYLRAPAITLAESREASALVPQWYVETQRWQHRVYIDENADNPEELLLSLVEHRMLGSFPNSGESPSPKHVLLMRFDSDFGLNWVWGDLGSMSFWIAKDDLEARKFENIICRMD